MPQFKDISPTAATIAVVGNNLTAYGVVAALTKLGYSCNLIYEPTTLQFQGPSLVLNDVCETLLLELFGDLNFEKFAQKLTYRWVHWGMSGESQQVYQPAWAIPSSVLLTQIQHSKIVQSVPVVNATQITSQELFEDYAWTVYCSHQQGAISIADSKDSSPLNSKFLGGQRVMITAEIPYDSIALRDSCYIESLSEGWLFYAPVAPTLGMLQACLPQLPTNPKRALLECLYHSRSISPLIEHLDNVRSFQSAPRLNFPLYGSRWLRVGESAVKLDPLSGEGTPFALRSSILAAAVIDSILHKPNDLEGLLNHYQTRLTHSFLVHLKGCCQYYQSVFPQNHLWQSEIHQMLDTEQALSSLLKHQKSSQLNYQLIGLKLQKV